MHPCQYGGLGGSSGVILAKGYDESDVETHCCRAATAVLSTHCCRVAVAVLSSCERGWTKCALSATLGKTVDSVVCSSRGVSSVRELQLPQMSRVLPV